MAISLKRLVVFFMHFFRDRAFLVSEFFGVSGKENIWHSCRARFACRPPFPIRLENVSLALHQDVYGKVEIHNHIVADFPKLEKLTQEFFAIGNNLNQLTRYFHMGGLKYTDYYLLLKAWKADYAPKSPEEEWDERFCEALQQITQVEYLLDTFLAAGPEDRIAIMNEYRKEAKELERRTQNRYLGADESDYTYELLKFFMMGAVARVFTPGIKFDYILCLVGEQGAGKSSFFRLLAINDDWFSDDLAEMDTSKVYEKLMGHWIIEMSEMLATNNAKSNELIASYRKLHSLGLEEI